MESKKSIFEVRNDIIFQLARTTPDALRGKFALDHLVWDIMEECNDLVVSLVASKIYKMKTIKEVISKFDVCIDIICDYLDATDQIILSIYWMSILNAMIEKCEVEDQFEACSNLKRFTEEYFVIMPENDDDLNDEQG